MSELPATDKDFIQPDWEIHRKEVSKVLEGMEVKEAETDEVENV